jgi:hypothetical protein
MAVAMLHEVCEWVALKIDLRLQGWLTIVGLVVVTVHHDHCCPARHT